MLFPAQRYRDLSREPDVVIFLLRIFSAVVKLHALVLIQLGGFYIEFGLETVSSVLQMFLINKLTGTKHLSAFS